MLYVLLKHLLLLCLKKLIRINKLLSLSIKTYMHVTCFIKTLIIILSKMHVAYFVKTLIVILSKMYVACFVKVLIRTNKLLSLLTKF